MYMLVRTLTNVCQLSGYLLHCCFRIMWEEISKRGKKPLIHRCTCVYMYIVGGNHISLVVSCWLQFEIHVHNYTSMYMYIYMDDTEATNMPVTKAHWMLQSISMPSPKIII